MIRRTVTMPTYRTEAIGLTTFVMSFISPPHVKPVK